VVVEPSDEDVYARLREGCAQFDTGRYWHAHESWEQAWLIYQAPDRCYLKGLIQLAAVQHHLQRGKHGAALALLRRDNVHRHLAAADPSRWPLDTGLLLAVLAAQHAALAAGRRIGPSRLRLLPMLPMLPVDARKSS